MGRVLRAGLLLVWAASGFASVAHAQVHQMLGIPAGTRVVVGSGDAGGREVPSYCLEYDKSSPPRVGHRYQVTPSVPGFGGAVVRFRGGAVKSLASEIGQGHVRVETASSYQALRITTNYTEQVTIDFSEPFILADSKRAAPPDLLPEMVPPEADEHDAAAQDDFWTYQKGQSNGLRTPAPGSFDEVRAYAKDFGQAIEAIVEYKELGTARTQLGEGARYLTWHQSVNPQGRIDVAVGDAMGRFLYFGPNPADATRAVLSQAPNGEPVYLRAWGSTDPDVLRATLDANAPIGQGVRVMTRAESDESDSGRRRLIRVQRIPEPVAASDSPFATGGFEFTALFRAISFSSGAGERRLRVLADTRELANEARMTLAAVAPLDTPLRGGLPVIMGRLESRLLAVHGPSVRARLFLRADDENGAWVIAVHSESRDSRSLGVEYSRGDAMDATKRR